MAHILIIRGGSSFVCGKNNIVGAHERIEEEINSRKYEINNVRKGYTIPFSSEWRFLDYRIKEEIIPEFVNNLSCINLNPTPNNTSLKKIFFRKKSNSGFDVSVNKIFYLIQWIFKWINKKKITSVFFILLSLLNVINWFWTIIIITLLFINPLKPIPLTNKPQQPYFNQWNMNFTIGYLKDPTQTYKLGNELIEVKDVL
jgi:hypothetical protein